MFKDRLDGLKKFVFGKKSAKRYSADFSYRGDTIPFNPQTERLRDYIKEDIELAANIRRFIDNILVSKPKLVKDNTETKITDSSLRSRNKQLENVRFYKNLRSAMFHLLWNGNAFFEIRWYKNTLKEMYVIEPETIEIKLDNDGEVIGYEQQVNGSPVATFSPEEIVHISIDNLDSGEWGHSILLPLRDAIKRKQIAEWYLQWIIQNNKFAPIVNIKSENMDEDKWAQLIQQFNLRANDPNILQVLNSFPEDEIEIIHLFTTDNFETITNYIEKQKEDIRNLVQVPPVNSAGMRNSDANNPDINSKLLFYNTLKSLQNVIADELDHKLLSKLKWSGVKFLFPTIDKKNDAEIIKLAKILKKDIGWTDEAVLEFMKSEQFPVPDVSQIFDPDFKPDNESGTTPDDAMPSREDVSSPTPERGDE